MWSQASVNKDSSLQSPSLSDIQAEDMDSSIFNQTASSTRTLASSLHAVDIPVFDDSQDGFSSPEKEKNSQMEWNTSPTLGKYYDIRRIP